MKWDARQMPDIVSTLSPLSLGGLPADSNMPFAFQQAFSSTSHRSPIKAWRLTNRCVVPGNYQKTRQRSVFEKLGRKIPKALKVVLCVFEYLKYLSLKVWNEVQSCRVVSIWTNYFLTLGCLCLGQVGTKWRRNSRQPAKQTPRWTRLALTCASDASSKPRSTQTPTVCTWSRWTWGKLHPGRWSAGWSSTYHWSR